MGLLLGLHPARWSQRTDICRCGWCSTRRWGPPRWLVIFMVGAVAWRLDYQRPLQEALPVIHRDRGRRAWIHTWMIVALVVTPAGLVGLTVVKEEPNAVVLAGVASAVYGGGGICCATPRRQR